MTLASFILLIAGVSIRDWAIKGADSTGKSQSESISFWLETYHDEFKTYVIDRKAPGFPILTTGFEVYFNALEVPTEYQNTLGEDRMPLMEKDDFRFVIKNKNKVSGNVTLWVNKKNSPPEMVLLK